MSFFIAVLIFILTLFLYIHITNQFKKSQDMEIYEAEFISNVNLQDICNTKQPVVVNLNNVASGFLNSVSISRLLNMGASHSVIVKDIDDYNKTSGSVVDCISLPFKTVLKLFESDTKSRFFSDSNSEFMDESGLGSELSELDEYLKPDYTVQSKYDIMFGSNSSHTPLRYSTQSRNYIVVASGKISVKMTPFKSTKYLHEVRDYENYEFRSEIDVWKPQKRFSDDFDRIKFIEFEVSEGNALYIPSYWWYSIKYSDSGGDRLLSCSYSTVMNRLANIPDIVNHIIQVQNTVVKVSNEHPSHIDSNIDDVSSKPDLVKMTPETVDVSNLD